MVWEGDLNTRYFYNISNVRTWPKDIFKSCLLPREYKVVCVCIFLYRFRCRCVCTNKYIKILTKPKIYITWPFCHKYLPSSPSLSPSLLTKLIARVSPAVGRGPAPQISSGPQLWVWAHLSDRSSACLPPWAQAGCASSSRARGWHCARNTVFLK